MIKKSIVIVQLAIALLLGAAILAQLGLPTEKLRQLDRKQPLWFMAPWRPQAKADAPRPASPQTAKDNDRDGPDMTNRRFILTPGPALDAIVTELEAKDLEAAGPPPLPAAAQTPAPAAVAKKGKKAVESHKSPAPAATAGPITITSLSVTPAGGNIVLRGLSSAPVARMELLTFASPPRVILELHGHFAPYAQPVAVPDNPLVASVSTEVSGDRMRVTAKLHTSKVSVTPALRSAQGSEFTVELMPFAAGAPQAATRP